MGKTIGTFRTELMQEFGLDEDNDNEGTSAEAILRYISESNAKFINHRAWKHRLKPKTQYIQEDTTVDVAFTTAATTCELGSTNNWGTAGRFLCDMDIIEFTGNNTTTDTLTIVTADIDRNHVATERCLLLYEVPTDYNKISTMFIDGRKYYLEDSRNGKEPSPGCFWEVEVKVSSGNIKKYLAFPYHTTQKKIYFWYAQKGTDFTALDPTTSYIEIPEPYWNFIKHDVSARIYRHLEEIKMAEKQEEMAVKLLREASVFDSKQHFGNSVPLRTEWQNPAAKLGITNRPGHGNYGHSNN